ncbi:MAG: N-formylglutamate amidohydrolase [Bacteroidota bacterium]
MKKMKIVITCEHGGNKIPKEYQQIFGPHKNLLASHRGYDIGALDLANTLYKKVGDYFFHSTTSRLLVELNRSLHHPKLFSVVTKPLDVKTKSLIKEKYYFPYLQSIDQTISGLIADDFLVLHISAHSFTPSLDGKVRNADIGILYDPRQVNEKTFSHLLKEKLRASTGLKVRLNYPYLGIADGLPTRLRKEYNSSDYIGIELEVNQQFLYKESCRRNEIQKYIAEACGNAVNSFLSLEK